MVFSDNNFLILNSPGAEEFAAAVHRALVEKTEAADIKSPKRYTISAKYFPNKEWNIHIPTNVRGRHIYAIHAFTDDKGNYDPNPGWMCLYLIGDALRRSSAHEITYVLPHIPYERQDRTDRPRVPISAKVTLDMLYAATAPVPMGIVAFDMHAAQDQGFTNCPTDHLNATNIFADYFRAMPGYENFVLVAPDGGAAVRTRHMAKKLGNNRMAMIDKRRGPNNEPEVMHILGEVKGSTCIIRDDLLDTGGTCVKASEALLSEGAQKVYVCNTHGVLSQNDPELPTEERIRRAKMNVVVTDSIPRSAEYLDANKDWLTVLSAAQTTAQAIYEIQTRGSVSKLIE